MRAFFYLSGQKVNKPESVANQREFHFPTSQPAIHIKCSAPAVGNVPSAAPCGGKKETGKMYKNVPARHSFPPLSPPSCALTRKSRQNVSVTAQQQPAEIQDNRAKRARDDKRIFITGVCL